MQPLGYTAQSQSYSYSWNQKKTIINYLPCYPDNILYRAILLESFKQPFKVISLIPYSFIGVFITFQYSKSQRIKGSLRADTSLRHRVNATLYILNDFNSLRRAGATAGRQDT
jgi:hypothetical protein